MAKNEKYTKRKLSSSYASTIVSISLVLFVLGLVGLLLLHYQTLSNYAKENVGFTIFLNENIEETAKNKFQKQLLSSNFVKTAEYIHKDVAAEQFQKVIGEDFEGFLGYNPIKSNFEIRLNAAYANPDSLFWVVKKLEKNELVHEISYHKDLIKKINKNTQQISLYLLCFSGLLLIVSLSLINNSIRLSIYSKRFLIKSMQLVGATKGFIRRPFLWKGILNGIYGGIFACLLILGFVFLIQKYEPELFLFINMDLVGILFVGILVTGFIISYLSTFFALKKYLKLKIDDLY